MKFQNRIFLLCLFSILIISCQGQTTEGEIEKILKCDFCSCCNFDDIYQWDYSIFDKLQFKYTGKRLQKKINNDLYCSINYNASKSLCHKYFEITFWEMNQEITMSREWKKKIIRFLNNCFGNNIGIHTIHNEVIRTPYEYELPYWENEEYYIYLYDSYELWGNTEKFENFKIIIQIK